MAGVPERERRREGGELHHPGNASLTVIVSWTTYLLMSVTGLGYLAFTWSTVVLLGGFVTLLPRKDFWCLTVISMLLAARIFNDLGDELVPKFSSLLIGVHYRGVSMAREWLAFQTIDQKLMPTKKLPTWLRTLTIIWAITLYLPLLPLLAACYIVVFLYGHGGPAICIGLALWRISQRDYGSNDGDMTKANLAPALNMFYGLILCQGVLYLTWMFYHLVGGAFLIVDSKRNFKLPREWGHIWLVDYYFDTRARCWKDSASIQGRTISHYAIDLIDSESWKDNLSGAKMLATFIRQGADIRLLLLPSRSRVQKLIDTLGWRATVTREMRLDAAIIVAHVAGDIHLSQFPGAIRCISTLLQDEATTQTYRWIRNQGRPQLHAGTGSRSTMHRLVRKFEKGRPKNLEEVLGQGEGDDDDAVQQKKHADDDDDETIGSCNEMILQSLTILERLATDHHNSMEICTSPGLLPKIMAPLCSSTLIQGVKSTAWADVINGSLKVLYSLMRCPGPTGTSLRREIFANDQAISNLESFLAQSSEACQENQELQMRAMEILTELALDVSINLAVEMKQSLMKKQLELFLEKESDDVCKGLRATAGRTLAFLSANSEVCSVIVRDHFEHLTEILDAKNNITYRMIAAQILENICAHCELDKDRMKDILLPKVLEEILSTKREQPQSDEEDKKKSAPVDDEENQNKCSPPGNDDENHSVSPRAENTEMQEISSTTEQIDSSDQGNDEQIATNELQEPFLSLALVIYDKLISTNDFDDALQKQGQGSAEFVLKLKTIVEDNCEETPISLRIVKLCGQIAASMMCRKHYTEQFKNQGFAESFSEAKKIMSNLESCILFAGTEFGQKKISMPLLSELEKKVKELAG